MSIKKIEGENYKIPDNAKVKIIDLGDTIQIKNSWKTPNNLKQFKKYNKNYCIDKETGELIKYDNSNLLKNRTSIRNSMQKLFQIIKLNFTGKDNELFLTLTCDSPVYELSKIKKYKELFIRRLKRKFKDSKFCYVYKFEQKKEKRTGKYTWHCHILLKDLNRKILYLDNDEIINPLWKKGFTRTERVLPDIKQSIASYMAKTTQLNQVKNGEKILLRSLTNANRVRI